VKTIRKIKAGGYDVQPVKTDDLNDNLKSWLLKQAQEYGLTTLLAHADDGVIWARVTEDGLRTSHEVFGDRPSPELRARTLQQARLFGKDGELLLWRKDDATGDDTDDGWRARLVRDDPEGEHYDQPQMLWGNRLVTSREGFGLVEEGRQGLRHAPPVEVPESEFENDRRPLYLTVRHYLRTDNETGVVDVALSRLVSVDYTALTAEKQEEVTA
jgi:CRISPR-associated protein (TIGR03984 family)